MKIEHRLAIASVRVAALRGLVGLAGDVDLAGDLAGDQVSYFHPTRERP